MTTVLDSGKRPLCICRKPKLRYQENPGSGEPWIYRKNCGQCPQRRASIEECGEAYFMGETLINCTLCGHALHLSIGSMEPDPTLYPYLKCLECALTKNEGTCECPKHFGDRICAANTVTECAISSGRVADNGMHFKKRFCYRCFSRYKPLTWLEYSANEGSHDKVTGEVIPLRGDVKPLRLTPAKQQYDPLASYGGMSKCWYPSKGIAGVTRLENGVHYPQWIAFLPRRYVYTRANDKPSRVLSVTRYNPDTTDPENTTLSTLWHSGVNAWCDSVLRTPDDPRPANVAPMGWCYVRLTGVSGPSDRHTLYTSRYFEVVREERNRERRKPSIREWVEWCHAQ